MTQVEVTPIVRVDRPPMRRKHLATGGVCTVRMAQARLYTHKKDGPDVATWA